MNDSCGDVVEPRAGLERRDQSVMMDQFVQLMSTIRESHEQFKSQLSAFKDEVRQGQEEAAMKALKRVRHEKLYQYKGMKSRPCSKQVSTRCWQKLS